MQQWFTVLTVSTGSGTCTGTSLIDATPDLTAEGLYMKSLENLRREFRFPEFAKTAVLFYSSQLNTL